ncbi:MAG: HlyD family secretion protein [Limisphaerales bacterium]
MAEPFETVTAGHPLPLLDHLAPLECGKRTRLPVRVRTLGIVALTGFVLLVFGLVFLPWQQFVPGSGRVIAYDPLERSVTVEAPLSGRVDRAFVLEGQAVRKGDVLIQMADNDPEWLKNLEAQRSAAILRRDAAARRIELLSDQIREQERALPLALRAASNRLEVAQFAYQTADLQFQRVKALHEDERGLASRREFEIATLDRDRTRTDVQQAKALLERVEPDLLSTIQSTSASRESARADLASAEQSVTALTIQINQAATQRIVAPRDGVVMRVQATEGTYLRAGSPVCTLIPETATRMVELWVDGNDMPLIQPRITDDGGRTVKPGSPVRIQFEGWPAIQFIGWPSVALGTFGGEVVVVDPSDNGQGKFRILVAPKPDEILKDDGRVERLDWPGPRWLRQGVRANGWVLLERVPLWYELWRQMNGFPPAIDPAKMGASDGK